MAREAKLSRTLDGHTRAVLCCHAPLSHPDLLATSAQDGTVSLYDLRNKENVQRYECFGGEAVSSVCFTPARSDIFYASAGASVYCIDTRLGSVSEATMKFDYNNDEINQVALNQKASYLAAADDSGEIKVIDLENRKLQKTLRGVHTNICSTVQFHPHRPWELISGGLDSKIVKWDFNKGRPMKVFDEGIGAVQPGVSGQFCNPPFVHVLAAPECKVAGKGGKVLAVARGNGAVEICDLALEKCHELRLCGAIANNDGQDKGSKGKTIQQEAVDGAQEAVEGRHLSAASSVTFARFEESRSFVISGSNDKGIKMWDWCKESDTVSVERSSRNTFCGQLLLNVRHKRKVNWICTAARSSENVFVADTSKRLSVYTFL
ncbi:hypothetical protein GOP47_0023536 [Adiantum capillus-veneris]|uniref:Uncharacterized protein n=1 Tax=Adiantum capillus-veneris TaxID=13818 RepID=A0A9D4Z605_ADICA|nr:hypothetical protein GOP47_0023536 [Adiantum capillus-veneris]